jgi:16S rRNA (guanine527-N7)-methyltransferase
MLKKLDLLCELFLEWNSKINLSSFKTAEMVMQKHIEDSLVLNEHIQLESKKVLDVGTGGGFPMLPLALSNPTANFVGIDSVQKKLTAVADMLAKLELTNVELIHERAETLAHTPDYREQFDVVVSRAFAKWPVNLELCLPFVKIGGVFVAYGGPSILAELEKYKNLEAQYGADLDTVITLELPDSDKYLVVVRKIAKCSKNYPRSYKKVRVAFDLI